MNIPALTNAVIVGHLAYDLLKNALPVSGPLLKQQAKIKTIEWLYEDAATEKIANRVNELAFLPTETPDQYCDRLEKDVVLRQLLVKFSPTGQVV